METRQAEVTVISARDIKKGNKLFPSAGKMKTYAVVSATGQGQRTRTPLDTEGGTDPNWNFGVRLVLPEQQLQAGHVALTVAVFSNGTLSDRELGRATVPLADFLNKSGGAAEFCSYQLHKPSSAKPNGIINISVKLAGQPDSPPPPPPPPSAYAAKGEPVTAYPAYPAHLAPGSSAYPAAGTPAPAGYPVAQGYYPATQGYYQGQGQGQGQGYYAQPAQRPRKNKFGMGLGAGLLGGALGGLLIGDLIGGAASHDAGYDAGYDAGFDDGAYDGGYDGGFDGGMDF